MDWREALPEEMAGLWKLGASSLVADARGDVRIELHPMGEANDNPPKAITVKAMLCPWLAEPHPTHLFLVKSKLYQAKPGPHGTWKILSGISTHGMRGA